jgi:NAD(P)-dependent dehydrogenase (short-subunit alcohol dehydrogenase family)
LNATPSSAALAGGFRLDDRSALVTGAGRGLGWAIAGGLAAAGAHVYLVSRTLEQLEQAAAAIRAQGGSATPLACDITSADDVRALIDALPQLDILVNNAGYNIPEAFVDVCDEHLDRLIGINVRAAFVVAQAATRKMLALPARKQFGGAVVHVTSQMGHVGAAGRTVYCMTKHALEGLTKAMAVELAPHNIRVNSVAPTFVITPLTAPYFEDPAFRAWALERIPLGRLGTVQEVTAAVVFLASPAASLITGTSLIADGGWTAQ